MTNIAQTINVLQAVILTDKEKLILTPTYHVFEMFSAHQGGKVIPMELKTPVQEQGGRTLPTVSASASLGEDGAITLSLVNTDPNQPIPVKADIGKRLGAPVGRILTAGAVNSHNTFAEPESVCPQPFADFTAKSGKLEITLPPRSVVVLTL